MQQSMTAIYSLFLRLVLFWTRFWTSYVISGCLLQEKLAYPDPINTHTQSAVTHVYLLVCSSARTCCTTQKIWINLDNYSSFFLVLLSSISFYRFWCYLNLVCRNYSDMFLFSAVIGTYSMTMSDPLTSTLLFFLLNFAFVHSQSQVYAHSHWTKHSPFVERG